MASLSLLLKLNQFALSFILFLSLNEATSKELIKRQINPCLFLNCLNNGKCVSYNNLAQCLCPKGFKGMKCEINELSPDCSLINCQNGGKCIQYTNLMAICYCPRPYVGKYCESIPGNTVSTKTTTKMQIALRKTEVCDFIVCPNGSKCKKSTYNLATCVYDEAMPKIEKPYIKPFVINMNKPSFCYESGKPRCQNGGKCIQKNETNGYCICMSNFTGAKCEYKLNKFDVCNPNPCPPENKCVSYNGQFFCFR